MKSLMLSAGVAAVCLTVSVHAGQDAFIARIVNRSKHEICLGSTSAGMVMVQKGTEYVPKFRRIIFSGADTLSADPETQVRRRLGELVSRLEIFTADFEALGAIEYKYLIYLSDEQTSKKLQQSRKLSPRSSMDFSTGFRPEFTQFAVQIFCRLLSPTDEVVTEWRSEKMVHLPDDKLQHEVHVLLQGKGLRDSRFSVREIAPHREPRWLQGTH